MKPHSFYRPAIEHAIGVSRRFSWLVAEFGRIPRAARLVAEFVRIPRAAGAAVVLLLTTHATLLAWQAWRCSPTIDEPAHLVAGLSHWKFGRFDLYRVNPPLVRLVAALPMLLVDPKTDWSGFSEAPYARPEFNIGTAFATANGFDTFWHFTLARWICIPFSVIGGYFCYRWARDLYCPASGIMALALWCFCPNILGNGALITPDVPAAAFGLMAAYFFWRWLSVAGFLRNPHPVALNPPSQPTAPATDTPPKTEAPPRAATVSERSSTLTRSASEGVTDALAGASGWRPWRPLGSMRPASSPSQLDFEQTGGWPRALLAGLTLGLAELTKSTWIILFVLWPLIWLIWKVSSRRRQFSIFNLHFSIFNTSAAVIGEQREPTDIALGCASRINNERDRPSSILHPRSSILQLPTILLVATYILNLGYGFENSFQRLDKFQFISHALGGPDAHTKPGNRFADTWLGAVPVPVPANYLRGLDVQRYDFEVGKWSYLRGEQKMGGWWYYYLYAMAVKMPVGTLFLIGLACVHSVGGFLRNPQQGALPTDDALGGASRLNDRGVGFPTCPSPSSSLSSTLDPLPSIPPRSRSSILLLAPALALLIVVSSQTGFNRYLRYVVPAFPFLFVWASQVARLISAPRLRGDQYSSNPSPPTARQFLYFRSSILHLLSSIVVVSALAATIASSLAVFPHSLSYFNELAGGPENGPAHLLDANIDWGQDLLELKRWCDAHPEARPLHVAYFGRVAPQTAGIESLLPPLRKGGPGGVALPAPDSPPLGSVLPPHSKGGPGGVALPTSGPPNPGGVPVRRGPPGWYAVSINNLYGYKHDGHETDRYAWLRDEKPIARAGYSIRIYRVP